MNQSKYAIDLFTHGVSGLDFSAQVSYQTITGSS